jgi:hypothetical protein
LSALHGHHVSDLAKQRKHDAHVAQLRNQRMVLLQREAENQKENQGQSQAKDVKQEDWERRLRAREQAAEAREKQVEVLVVENEQRMSDLEMRKIRLDEMENKLDSRKAKIDQCENGLASDKAEEISELRAAQQRAASERAALDVRQDEISSSERGLAAKQAELATLDRGLVEHERKLKDQSKDISARDQQLQEAEHQVEAERHRLGERSRELEELRKQCSSREAVISEREAAVRHREMQTQQERKSIIADKEHFHEDDERLRSRWEQEIGAERSRLQEMETKLCYERQELADRAAAQEAEDARHTREFETREARNLEMELRNTETERQLRKLEMSQDDVNRHWIKTGQQYEARAAQDRTFYQGWEERLRTREQSLDGREQFLRAVEVREESLAAREQSLAHAAETLEVERAELRRKQIQSENRAKFSLIDCAEAALAEAPVSFGEVPTASAARLGRKSAPPAHFGAGCQEAASRRTRLTARKNIAAAPSMVFAPSGAADFVTPASPKAADEALLGLKRGRCADLDADDGTHRDELEAPDPKARVIDTTDVQNSESSLHKDTASGLSRFVAPFGGFFRRLGSAES